MNLVIITNARFTKEPDVRYTTGENTIAIARFTLAVDKNYKKSKDEPANFINCVCFGKVAEVVEKHCTKGTKVNVTGEWTTGNYKNKDGNTVYTNDCNVSKLEFAESKSSQQSQNNDRPNPMTDSDGFMNIPDNLEDEGLPFS